MIVYKFRPMVQILVQLFQLEIQLRRLNTNEASPSSDIQHTVLPKINNQRKDDDETYQTPSHHISPSTP